MRVYIGNKDILKLYETGKSKKLRLPVDISDKFFATVQKIEAAVTIYDLWKDRSLNFEKLKGFENRYSVRLSLKYRLEIEIEWENDENTAGKFILVEISRHYGD